MFIGYARIFPEEQTLRLQKDALTKAGCTKIHTGTAMKAEARGRELAQVLALLRPGDVFVVWKLDCLGTSIKDLTTTMLFLSEQGIGIKSLMDKIDTTANGGTQVFRIFQALQAVMKAKTTAGRRVARAKGRKGGRPKLLTGSQIWELQAYYNSQTIPITEILRKFHLSRSTLYRYVKCR